MSNEQIASIANCVSAVVAGILVYLFGIAIEAPIFLIIVGSCGIPVVLRVIFLMRIFRLREKYSAG